MAHQPELEQLFQEKIKEGKKGRTEIKKGRTQGKDNIKKKGIKGKKKRKKEGRKGKWKERNKIENALFYPRSTPPSFPAINQNLFQVRL